MTRKLTDAEIEESLKFGQGALAAAGHFVDAGDVADNVRAVLRGEMTMDEYEEFAYRRATGS